MNIIFMGTPAFPIPVLKSLIDSHHRVIAVVTQPDRPHGRGMKPHPPPIKTLALSKKIMVFQPDKANSDDGFIKRLNELKPEIIIVAAYGQILSEKILRIPEYGCINLHASLLPKYRGAAPINWTLINGEKISGVTVIKMDKGMDTGNILFKETVQIMPSDNAITLHDKLSEIGAKAVFTTVELIEKGTVMPEPQDNRQATYAPRIKKEDGLIDWNTDAEKIVRQIKGFVPWPCAYTYFAGDMIKLWDAEPVSDRSNKIPGEVAIIRKNELVIAAGKGSVRVKEIQMQSRQRMMAREFIQGNILKSGDMFDNR